MSLTLTTSAPQAGWLCNPCHSCSPQNSWSPCCRRTRGEQPATSPAHLCSWVCVTDSVTVLEDYFSRALGFAFLTLALLNVLLTGAVPLTSVFAESMIITSTVWNKVLNLCASDTSTDLSSSGSPFTVPILTVTMVFHSVMAVFLYTQYLCTRQSMFAFHVAGYGALAAMGLWCLLFAGSQGKVSRKSGADKRTSGFPFANAEADKRKAGKKRI